MGANPMCGICGYAGMERDERLLRTMTGRLRHRGPDDGIFMHERVGLGMRRLSIIDVSGGARPFSMTPLGGRRRQRRDL
jgi:asparagine synthase (glutamine-hydrolysing)